MKDLFLDHGNFVETVLPLVHDTDEVMLSTILFYRVMSNF